MLSLPYSGTRPCGPKVFLLLRALASPSTSAVVCACMAQGLGPWIVAQRPTASGKHCAPTQLKVLSLRAVWGSDGQQISWVPTCRACTGAGSTHTWRATERRLHFDSPTRTRVNSDSSVNDGYCFRLFSVDTSPSTYFSPFPSRTLPRSTRTMTDSGQLRSSISLLGNHAEFLLSRSTSVLNTLQASHALWFLLEETETSTNGQNSKVSWHSIVDQSVRIDLPCGSGAPRPVGHLAGAATFLNNRKYRYRPYTQPDVGNCWPWRSPVDVDSPIQVYGDRDVITQKLSPKRPLLCAVGILKVDSCLLNVSYNNQIFLNWTELNKLACYT